MGYAARRAVWVGKIVATWAFVIAMMAVAANIATRF
jgi:hypothetical protein